MNDHPLAIELVAAASYEPGTEPIHRHVRDCASCQIDYDVIRHDLDEIGDDVAPELDEAAITHILSGALSLPPALTNAAGASESADAGARPVAGDLWRIGNTQEALMVVVLNDDEASAVIAPLVLDLDMADETSLYIDAAATPLGVEAILLNDLTRTVAFDAFLNRIGAIDPAVLPQAASAPPVQVALIGNALAFPVHHDRDERLDYRFEIADSLDAITASAAAPAADTDYAGQTPSDWSYSYPFETLRSDLQERIFGCDLSPLPRTVFDVRGSHALTCLAKVTHLQTSTVIAALSGPDLNSALNATTLAATCRGVLRHEADANAVAVVLPFGDWVTALFTSADTNPALATPTGSQVGPTTTYVGYGILDTMHKYLDGRVTSWEETDATPTRLSAFDLHAVAQRHSEAAVAAVRKSGNLSKPPKKAVWADLPNSTDEAITAYVRSLLESTPPAKALDALRATIAPPDEPTNQLANRPIEGTP